ncbi:MAG TPA: prepilin-type N-terminal cleavage/methylation domain-containing protein [Polyangiaceae bacterium]|jgi:prepilin-type N-terminal cleavage/methylation domain-containing protein
MGCRRRTRGFTLIEAMIVVVVVGVLALLAVVAYRRWVQSSYVAEAQDMVSNIRTAEEGFYAENGGYLDVSGCLGINCTYPLQKPGSSKTAWGGPCGWCTNPTTAWGGLTVHPNAPLIFGYAVIADKAIPMSSRVGAIKVNGKLIDVTSAPAGAPWYFVEADANVSGDSLHYMHVYGMAGNNQIWVDEEGN